MVKKEKIYAIIDEYLAEFGLKKADLVHLADKLHEKPAENVVHPFQMTKEERQKMEKRQEKIVTPERYIEQFATEIEEFYPNGRK